MLKTPLKICLISFQQEQSYDVEGFNSTNVPLYFLSALMNRDKETYPVLFHEDPLR